ncbi:uncharacterized protein LOC128218920 isoform X2 [Mya arenaria]|uniref:uncharacterized protein LOC128218920 isoform X2 n=1 Tax=Mya arenaria TaxID=6604 RepID=UPI0022E77B30|nr:uncharacterized protein LOC128218920 isoform X2 [Mya arenaria]
MSVILSACRHTKQKAIARALKKKAEKMQRKRLLRQRKEAELQELEASVLDSFSKLWSFEIEGEYYQIVLYLAHDKDTVDIFCNEDEVIGVITNCTDEGGATFDFVIGNSYKARISCCRLPGRGLDYNLTIDGYRVPAVE